MSPGTGDVPQDAPQGAERAGEKVTRSVETSGCKGAGVEVAEVRRPLMSVSKMTAAGNEVRLSDKNPYIGNLRNGQKTALRKEGNVFVIDLWVKVPNPPGV